MPTDKRIISVRDSYLVASFPYRPELVDIVKSLPGRRWSPKSRVWFWGATPSTVRAVVDALTPHGFTVDDSIKNFFGEMETKTTMSRAMSGRDIPGLYPFQVSAVDYARKVGFRVLIADEMGCGKTVEAIAATVEAGCFPALVVCPSAVKLSWKTHIEKWAGPNQRIEVLSGRDYEVQPADWYVVNYDILDAGKFEGIGTLIVDESHYIKSHTAKRYDEVHMVGKNARVVFCLDGTPILNRPRDLWTVLNLLRPDLYPRFFPFGLKFCAGTKTPFGWNFNGASNLDALAMDLRGTCMIRRTKIEVLTELPEKTRSFMPIAIDMDEYRSHEEEFLAWLDDKYDGGPVPAKALVKFSEMRRHVGNMKFKDCVQWARDFLASDRSLVIFTHHKAFAAKFAKALDGVLYSGDVTLEERNLAVSRFQAGDVRVIALTLDSGAEGITLHKAQDAMFFEMAWNASRQRQAEDRLHRIGQRGAVTCYYPYAAGTVEEDIIDLLAWKASSSDAGLSDTSDDAFSAFMISRVRKTRKRG